MKNFARIARLTSIALFAQVILVGAASAGQQVVVKFTDGSQVEAEFDKRTNDDRLVLRFQGETSVLLRSVVWNRVKAIVPVTRTTSVVRQTNGKTIQTISATHRASYAERATQALADPSTPADTK